MKDVVQLLSALILGYICFASVGLFLGKLFFPFFTREELRKQRRVALKKRKTLMTAQ